MIYFPSSSFLSEKSSQNFTPAAITQVETSVLPCIIDISRLEQFMPIRRAYNRNIINNELQNNTLWTNINHHQSLTLFNARLFADNNCTFLTRGHHICIATATTRLLSQKITDEPVERGVGIAATCGDQLHNMLGSGSE